MSVSVSVSISMYFAMSFVFVFVMWHQWLVRSLSQYMKLAVCLCVYSGTSLTIEQKANSLMTEPYSVNIPFPPQLSIVMSLVS